MLLSNKTAFITGASRGIGKAIALKLAEAGANIVIAAKSIEENVLLGGTIYSAAKEVEQAGGKALAVKCDVRNENEIKHAVEQAIETFGGIDILINNASAISLTSTLQTEPKRYDLMFDVNVRGAFFASQYCIPYLKKSTNPHILFMSPPLNFRGEWLQNYLAYSISKFNMTMMAMGLADELRRDKIAVNSLWPKTTIATAAIKNIVGGEAMVKRSRNAQIVADAAFHIFKQSSANYSGRSLIDEDVLISAGVSNFEQYAIVPGGHLQSDLFL